MLFVLSLGIGPHPHATGMYKGGSYKFTFNVSEEYPHKPPKVKCVPKVG